MSDWDPLLERLALKRDEAGRHGGPEKLARFRAAGKLTALERVVALLDDGTFREIGTLTGTGIGVPRDALVAGHGTIDGRPVLVGAEDATVMGGSIGSAGASKRERIARLALQERVPLVMLLDGAGHRVTNTLERRNPAPNDLTALARLSGVVPTVAVVHGASAGHGALCAPLCDVIVMVEGQGQLFTAGPPLVVAATGEQVDKETLGGAAVQLTNGVGHLGAADDREALALVRRYLGYLAGPVQPYDGHRRVDELLELIPTAPRRPYDIRPVIDAVCDRDSVLELQPGFGSGMVTALARLGGVTVAVVANQPAVRSGAIDVPGAQKAARFLQLAAAHHVPVVFLADNPGVLPGTEAERQGALRAAADLFLAQHRHPGPKLHVTLRKAYGFGSSAMAQNPFSGQTVTLALPDATVGAMPARGGSDAAKLDDATRSELSAAEAGGPWRMADTLSYDEVVHPGELRDALLDALRLSLHRL